MTVKYSDVNLGQIEAVLNKIGGEVAIQRLLAGELVVVEREPPASKPEVPLDTIIRVNRSVRPIYPDWMEKVMHPELEATGPATYGIDVIVRNLWLHKDQKNGGRVKGQVYDYFKSNDMLVSCLDLRDLEAIKSRGIDFFRKHFAGKAIFGWKSVVRDRYGRLYVPYLVEFGGEVVVYWSWLGYDWLDSAAPRLASQVSAVH